MEIDSLITTNTQNFKNSDLEKEKELILKGKKSILKEKTYSNKEVKEILLKCVS